jgi:hypothetical protein
VLPEDLRQHDLAGHQALGRQHAADGRQRNQPADAAHPLKGHHTGDADQRAVQLADAQQLERRHAVAQRAADGKGQKAWKGLEGEGDAGPGDAAGGFKHHQGHEE